MSKIFSSAWRWFQVDGDADGVGDADDEGDVDADGDGDVHRDATRRDGDLDAIKSLRVLNILKFISL